MTFAELISLLEKQVKLHKSLYQLALKKTEALKKHDVETLTALMKDEQKHILAIQQLEHNRMNMMRQWGKGDDFTMTHCIEMAAEPERSTLSHLYDQLAKLLVHIKQANELNQQLTEQSLQFIYLTLDMIAPQTQPITYSKNTYEEPLDRSMFESKA